MRNDIGKIYLIGAGCGDWELITLKGLNRLKLCDFVVYDRLIPTKLLEYIPRHCRKIYVGKESGHHSITQDKINETIVNLALNGHTVARLKGGDPFVFGRGGEEIQALQKHDIPYEVVSGISSSIAVPSSVGIPVTHRGVARSFHVVTGHTLEGFTEDFSVLARLNGTLIFLMALGSIEIICNGLISNGMDINTPCAIISNGTTQHETVYRATLSTIIEYAHMARSPSMFVVGQTTKFNFRTTIEYPLSGINIVVTGTERFTSQLDDKLSELGATVIKFPHLRIESQYTRIPNDFTVYSHIVFTSVNGVETFFRYLRDTHTDIRNILNKKFATIGKSTANALATYGIYADIIPNKYTSKSLADAIVQNSAPLDRYLILRASNGSNILPDILAMNGILYDDVKIYTISCDDEVLAQKFPNLDYIVFGSSMGVREYFKHKTLSSNTKIVCIGEICKSALDSLNVENSVCVPRTYDIDGIVESLVKDVTKYKVNR